MLDTPAHARAPTKNKSEAASAAVSTFLEKHYRHFNAATLIDAARAWKRFCEQKNGKMFVSLAGAMSTAEMGILLAQMIRADKISAICCTGANLEEDVFNAIAHNAYRRVPQYWQLTAEEEENLLAAGMNRVTDTCIPEDTAISVVGEQFFRIWKQYEAKGERRLPHEIYYELILDKNFQKKFQIPREHSWLLAAAEKGLPLYVPGWEDSTTGNVAVAMAYEQKLSLETIKGGLHYMDHLFRWYMDISRRHPMGFFQIGGGIAGDFAICVVPLLNQETKADVPIWQYFCQITDAQESYGGYSGARPNEKITWGKLDSKSERFSINSDATIAAPLIFAYVLGL